MSIPSQPISRITSRPATSGRRDDSSISSSGSISSVQATHKSGHSITSLDSSSLPSLSDRGSLTRLSGNATPKRGSQMDLGSIKSGSFGKMNQAQGNSREGSLNGSMIIGSSLRSSNQTSLSNSVSNSLSSSIANSRGSSRCGNTSLNASQKRQ